MAKATPSDRYIATVRVVCMVTVPVHGKNIQDAAAAAASIKWADVARALSRPHLDNGWTLHSIAVPDTWMEGD